MYSLVCPSKIAEEFKRLAKKAFPKETISYLCGTLVGDSVVIDALYTPDNVGKYSTSISISIQPEWSIEAAEFAKEEGLCVVGDVHSHPVTKEDRKLGVSASHAQSEVDLESRGLNWQQISGICLVTESKTGKLRASIKFWGPTIPLDVRIQ